MKVILIVLLFIKLVFAAETDNFKEVTEQELGPNIKGLIDRFCESYGDPERCVLELGTLPLDQIEDILGLNHHSAGHLISSGFASINSSGSYSVISYFSSLEEEGIRAHCESYGDPEQCVLEAKALLWNQTGKMLDVGHHSPGGFGPVEVSDSSFSVREGS